MLKVLDVDLDNNGTKEKIEVVETIDSGTEVADGRIKITDANGKKDIIFKEGGSPLTGVMQDIQFEDLDRDGVLDIFIVIPDIAGSYKSNYFFMYNYKSGKQFIFDYDYSTETVGKFFSSIKLKYHSEGMMEISSDMADYTGVLKVQPHISTPVPNDGKWYDNKSSPIPISIENEGYGKTESQDKYISSIRLDKQNDEINIVVPYLLAGLHHEDIIAEIDIYFTVNSNFDPVKEYFKVYNVDQEGSFKKTILNSCEFVK